MSWQFCPCKLCTCLIQTENGQNCISCQAGAHSRIGRSNRDEQEKLDWLDLEDGPEE